MWLVKVSEQGSVVIPKRLREVYGLGAGSVVNFVDLGEGIGLMPINDESSGPIRGMLTDSGFSATEELLKERARDRDREEAKIEYWTNAGEDGDA